MSRRSERPSVVAVVGATATGKSDLGVALAQALDAEVVNADSMQLYEGMDIGTAKLTVAERAGVPHHLLDVWPVTRTASVVDYRAEGRAVVDQLLAEGRSVVVVGGSGLYVRALLDDLEFPGTDPQVRAALERDLTEVGAAGLHARLAALDPDAAASIAPTNGRRVVRALEVVELTGSYAATLPDPVSAYDRVAHVGLAVDRPTLAGRVQARVERMWERGLVDEVEVLARDHGLREGRTASRALGYAQVLALLDGEIDEATARAQTVAATRRFARRQEAWFRRDTRIAWLDPAAFGDGGVRPGAASSGPSAALVAAALSSIERSLASAG